MWVYMGVKILGKQHRPFFPPKGTWLRWRTDSNWVRPRRVTRVRAGVYARGVREGGGREQRRDSARSEGRGRGKCGAGQVERVRGACGNMGGVELPCLNEARLGWLLRGRVDCQVWWVTGSYFVSALLFNMADLANQLILPSAGAPPPPPGEAPVTTLGSVTGRGQRLGFIPRTRSAATG